LGFGGFELLCVRLGGSSIEHLYAESFLKQYTHSAPPAPGEALA
jgi:hypothetical protein